MKKRYKKDYPEYKTYRQMFYQCYPSKNKSTSYERKGIKVCDRWQGPEGFWNFLEDLGEKPDESFVLNRRDKQKNYTPENCYWGKKTIQKRYITFEGKTLSVEEWAEALNISASTINKRYRKGLPIFEVLTSNNPKHISITYKNKTYNLKGFCREFNLPYRRTQWRYNDGWSIEDIINEPNQNETPTRFTESCFRPNQGTLIGIKELNKIKKSQAYKNYMNNIKCR